MISTRLKAGVIITGLIMIISGAGLAVRVSPGDPLQSTTFLVSAMLIIFGALVTVCAAITPRRKP